MPIIEMERPADRSLDTYYLKQPNLINNLSNLINYINEKRFTIFNVEQTYQCEVTAELSGDRQRISLESLVLYQTALILF